MKVNLRKIRKQRRYTDAFKKQLVREFESGKRIVEVKQSSKKKVKGLGNPREMHSIHEHV